MKQIEIASAVILNSKNDLLLVRKKGSEYFQLTGGKINKNESKIETVIREIKEEINLEINDSELDFLGQHQTLAVNESETIVIGNIFLIRLTDNFVPQIANEIEEFKWLNKENYKDYKWAHLAEEFVQPIWLKIISLEKN